MPRTSFSDMWAIHEVLNRALGRPRAVEHRSGLTGPCRSCHGRGGGGWFSMHGNEPAPERPCPRCGKLGPPAKIIRIVERFEEQTEREAER